MKHSAEQGARIFLQELQSHKLDIDDWHQVMTETLAELEGSRNRYSVLYDSSPLGYVTFDSTGRIIEVNLTAANLIGMERSQLLNTPMYLFVVKSDVKLFLDHLRRCKLTDEKVVTELGLVTKSGEAIQVELISTTLSSAEDGFGGYGTVISDITERRVLEVELSRLDRLNLIGEIAASIAHEVRNPMTTVRGFLQLFREKTEFAQHREHFNLMIDELDRANFIITEFLSLARNKAVKMIRKALNAQVEALLPLIEASALLTDNTVEVVLGDIPNFLMDEKEIRQLILNLAQNGLQAMSPGGRLVIKTSTMGNDVVLAVTDQGEGIEPDILRRMGTPFFTTKEDGTGLGLAVCHSIAARHNAVIEVDTSETGTTLFVLFRLVQEGGQA